MNPPKTRWCSQNSCVYCLLPCLEAFQYGIPIEMIPDTQIDVFHFTLCMKRGFYCSPECMRSYLIHHYDILPGAADFLQYLSRLERILLRPPTLDMIRNRQKKGREWEKIPPHPPPQRAWKTEKIRHFFKVRPQRQQKQNHSDNPYWWWKKRVEMCPSLEQTSTPLVLKRLLLYTHKTRDPCLATSLVPVSTQHHPQPSLPPPPQGCRPARTPRLTSEDKSSQIRKSIQHRIRQSGGTFTSHNANRTFRAGSY